MPTESIKTKTVFRWGCCRSGDLTVKIWLERAGYVPGETILLYADLDNQSHSTVLGSSVSFIEVRISFSKLLNLSKFYNLVIQSVDFHTHNKSKTYERVLCETKRRGWESPDAPQIFPIGVPVVTPSYLQFCEIIDVSYKIEVTILFH